MAPPRRPWPEPLPERLALDDLPTGALGLADEPDRQRRVPFAWECADGHLLLYGVAGSGTTTTLATLALALGRAHSPDQLHVYVVDFGNGALSPLRRLPHVGAVVLAGERERQERLVRTLGAELERRRRTVGAGGVQDWPCTVLLVDNLGAFHAAFDDAGGGATRDGLQRLLGDGPALGMAVVATADRPAAIPLGTAALMPRRLLFRLPDPYDYAAFGVPPGQAPPPVPGRAFEPGSGRQVQVAMAYPAADDSGLGAAVSSLVPTTATRPPAEIPVLPDRVPADEILPAARLAGPEWFVPVGIGDSELTPVGFRLGEGDHVLVAGPARSGRTTALCTLAAVAARTRPDVTITAVCLRRSALRDSAAVGEVVAEAHHVAGALSRVADDPGPQLVLVDDADMVDDPTGALSTLVARPRPGLHVVAAGRADVLRTTYGHWVSEVRRSRQGIALRPHVDLDGDLWHTALPRRHTVRFLPGRGYLVMEGEAELLQVAQP